MPSWYQSILDNYAVMSRKEAKRYGKHISKEWKKMLSVKERLAIVMYKGFLCISAHKRINSVLRDDDIHSSWYKFAQLISDALSKSEIDANIVCFRETNKEFLIANGFDETSIQTGDSLTEKGFLSTFAYQQSFTRGKVSLMIFVPSGTKGAYINSISLGHFWEKEILFMQGLKLIVVGVCKKPRRLYLKLRMENTSQ